MRFPVHDVPVHFRASSGLIAVAQLTAQREGMSLSELLRAPLRREITRPEEIN
jgi:hypothetical protein